MKKRILIISGDTARDKLVAERIVKELGLRDISSVIIDPYKTTSDTQVDVTTEEKGNNQAVALSRNLTVIRYGLLASSFGLRFKRWFKWKKTTELYGSVMDYMVFALGMYDRQEEDVVFISGLPEGRRKATAYNLIFHYWRWSSTIVVDAKTDGHEKVKSIESLTNEILLKLNKE